jgi:hypothetical protein
MKPYWRFLNSSRNYLYLIDVNNHQLKKVKDFEEIKNPKYVSKYNLIDNYAVPGKNWTEFYEINNDSLRDFKITIYDDMNDPGSTKYEKDYKIAIAKIRSLRKRNLSLDEIISDLIHLRAETV